ncbi:MAG: Bug family tripartite tricarboxylate transporter substrate binding protein [Burkholderiales bacterium]
MIEIPTRREVAVKAIFGVALSFFALTAAWGQQRAAKDAADPAPSYPNKAVRIITPYTSGSPVDVLARVVAQDLTNQLGQSVIVENRPGAGTTIGNKLAATATPDGYTLLITGTANIAYTPSLYPEAGYPDVGFNPDVCAAMFAPATTPAAILNKLNAAVNAGLASAELKATFAKFGMEPKPSSPQELGSFMVEQVRKWPGIIKAAGVRPE